MNRTLAYILICVSFIIFSGCNKKDTTNNVSTSLTIESLSGTYGLKALVWVSSSETINVYNGLDSCEKDNLIKLNADKTANFLDAGMVCSPPENDNGAWDIKGDSLYLNPGVATKIQSFD